MKDLSTINKKIEELKNKKREVEKKEALLLYKKLKAILGTNFSCDLILGLVSHTWDNKNAKMKEVWLQKAEPFRSSQKAQREGEAIASSNRSI